MTMFKEKVVAHFDRYICDEQVEVFVTLPAGSEYYNVYICNERYKTERLNSLYLQEPTKSVDNPEEYFDDAYMASRMMEYIIWDRFYDLGAPSVSVKISPEEVGDHQEQQQDEKVSKEK